MVDLETLSTRANAVILIIGAIRFKLEDTFDVKKDYTSLNPKNVFYRRIKIKSCIDKGQHIDTKTRDWWNEQNEKSKYEALINPERVGLEEALKDFSIWFESIESQSKRTYVWGNGSGFDITILGESFEVCKIPIPWKFWLVRDLRTLFDLGGVRMKDLPENGKHHALHDCYRQIIGAQLSIKNIRK